LKIERSEAPKSVDILFGNKGSEVDRLYGELKSFLGMELINSSLTEQKRDLLTPPGQFEY
jgi:hypothetical protein